MLKKLNLWLYIFLWLVISEVLGTTNDEVTLSLYTKQNYCPYFKNRGPSRQDNLKNCTWYKENSCCVNSELESAFSQLNPIPGASEKCAQYLNYLYCYICAPHQNTFFERSTLIVCEEFCDRIYSSCKKALLKGMKIEQMYANGKQFCEGRRFATVKKAVRSCFSYDPNSGNVKSRATRVTHLSSVCYVYLFIHILQTFMAS